MSRQAARFMCSNCGRRMQGLAKPEKAANGTLHTVYRCSKYEIDRSTGRLRCPNLHINRDGASA